jgi:excisionase family DNA binding protein
MRTIPKTESTLSGLELERLLTQAEAARLLACSQDTVTRLVQKRLLRRIQISTRRHGFRVGDLLAYINGGAA